MRGASGILVALVALGLTACGDGSGPATLQQKGNAAVAQAGAQEAQAETKAAPQTPSTSTTGEESETTDTTPTTPSGDAAGSDGGGDDDHKTEISSADFPEGTWPLTVESGELRCEDTKTTRTIIFSANGQDYPVNGVPKGGQIIGIEPIWKKKQDPNSPGTRMDISPLFKRGYELCD